MTTDRERTVWSPGLIGFYLSCGCASLGGAVAGVGFFVFSGEDYASAVVIVGVVMMVAGLLGGIRFLKAARGQG